MRVPTHHISVCICTYKRPHFLQRLLTALLQQRTDGLFTYAVVVADNDRCQSAQKVVTEFAAGFPIAVLYCVEPQQNIAMARNKAVANAQGDFIAFIDDDEVPATDWLYHLFQTITTYQADGVLGPVEPSFEHIAPQWILKGKFFERPTYATGYGLTWSQTRTGNVLFKKDILRGNSQAFRAEFGSGSEDVDFFRRMMAQGSIFVWCKEAVVRETVPVSRCTRSYLLRRALLRGSTFPLRHTRHIHSFATSLCAVPLYTVALPILAVCGQHVFLTYLIKLCDHLSRIAAYLGWQLMSKREM